VAGFVRIPESPAKSPRLGQETVGGDMLFHVPAHGRGVPAHPNCLASTSMRTKPVICRANSAEPGTVNTLSGAGTSDRMSQVPTRCTSPADCPTSSPRMCTTSTPDPGPAPRIHPTNCDHSGEQLRNSCVLPWSWWCVSRVELVRSAKRTPKAPLTHATTTSTIKQPGAAPPHPVLPKQRDHISSYRRPHRIHIPLAHHLAPVRGSATPPKAATEQPPPKAVPG